MLGLLRGGTACWLRLQVIWFQYRVSQPSLYAYNVLHIVSCFRRFALTSYFATVRSITHFLTSNRKKKLFSNARSRDEHFVPSFVQIPPSLSTEMNKSYGQRRDGQPENMILYAYRCIDSVVVENLSFCPHEKSTVCSKCRILGITVPVLTELHGPHKPYLLTQSFPVSSLFRPCRSETLSCLCTDLYVA